MAEEKDFFVENHIKIGDFLAVGEKYIVYNEYETVCLFDKNANRYIDDIGDFYGDPTGAIINDDETLCVMYGEGVIVYRLQEPFESFMYGRKTSQWIVYGRENPKKIKWVEDCYFVSEDSFEIVLEGGTIERLKITENGLVQENPPEGYSGRLLHFRLHKLIIDRFYEKADSEAYTQLIVNLLCENIGETIDMLEHWCTVFDFVWCSDVWVHVAKRTKSANFVSMLRRIYDKMPRMVQKSIEGDLTLAEAPHESRL